MTAEAGYPNKDALSSALDIYLDAMRPFIVRCMRRISGKRVEDAITDVLNDRRRNEFQREVSRGTSVAGAIEVGDFPHLVSRYWRDVFGSEFDDDRAALNRLWSAAEARNRAAHRLEGDIDTDYVLTRLHDVTDVLERIKAHDAASAVQSVRTSLQREPAPSPAAPRPVTAGSDAKPNGLKPWREVARPNTDVTDNTFREAEFAADLQQVHDGRAADEYGNPVSFFERTHLTPGMRTLLENALQRVSGAGGDPVIQAKTGFGGGKTHSLIALYHVAQNTGALTGSDNPVLSEIRDLVQRAGLDLDAAQATKVAVLDCTHLSPTSNAVTNVGDPRNTLWGELAYQLGGQDAYEIVGAAAREGTAPGGGELDELLDRHGPCVILIDELVAYARNVRGGGRDSLYTFVHNLTIAVRRSTNAVLVITLPEHDAEAGDDTGAAALAVLDGILGRIEAVWEPLAVGEAFEVVRRRLFAKIDENERDRTCETFSRMYRRSPGEYPQGVSEQRYLQRMKECYPIHPEIFDRLYEDWSSIPRFQRTRGVLRMMANCISRLYRDDAGPLIMPGSLPFADNALSAEFKVLQPGQWDPVLTEVDSINSRADAIDSDQQRFGEVGGAARRIARTIFLGSAPSGAVRGITEHSIHLGVVQPGHGISVYNEALARMAGELHYLYAGDGRYWFHAEENLNKVAIDRQAEVSDPEVFEHIVVELQNAIGRPPGVIVCPQGSIEVPDDSVVWLVVLPPDKPLPSRTSEADAAGAAALDMLLQRGGAKREHANALLFLAAKSDDLRALKSSVRTYLAWDSIVNGDRKILNLTGERLAQARASLTSARAGMESALIRAWRHALAPAQTNPQVAKYQLTVHETAADRSGEIISAALDKLVNEEALVDGMSPAALTNVLDKHVWAKSEQHHVALSDLQAMFTSYVYLPRLRNADVLSEAVSRGVEDGAFGYADGYADASYAGLRWREPLGVLPARGRGLLVKPEIAAELSTSEQSDEEDVSANDSGSAVDEPQPEDAPRRPVRVTASATMQDDISLDQVRKLQDAIIRSLHEDGGEITIQITIEANKAGGFSEHVERIVRENGPLLGVDIDVSD